MFKLRGPHQEQHAGQFLQCREFSIIYVGLLILDETVECEPTIHMPRRDQYQRTAAFSEARQWQCA
jgi:hypothetical protein